MLRSSSGLRSHLELANLALRQAAIVAVGSALLLRLRVLRLLGLLAKGVRRLWVLTAEIYTGRSWWDLALCLEQSRLQVDDVVAELVVLGLQGLVELA